MWRTFSSLKPYLFIDLLLFVLPEHEFMSTVPIFPPQKWYLINITHSPPKWSSHCCKLLYLKHKVMTKAKVQVHIKRNLKISCSWMSEILKPMSSKVAWYTRKKHTNIWKLYFFYITTKPKNLRSGSWLLFRLMLLAYFGNLEKQILLQFEIH